MERLLPSTKMLLEKAVGRSVRPTIMITVPLTMGGMKRCTTRLYRPDSPKSTIHAAPTRHAPKTVSKPLAPKYRPMTAPTGTYEGPWHTGMRRKNSTWMSEATPAPRKVD